MNPTTDDGARERLSTRNGADVAVSKWRSAAQPRFEAIVELARSA